MRTPSEIAAEIENKVFMGETPANLDKLLEEWKSLAAKAFSGDQAARSAFQFLLYKLNYTWHEPSEYLRAFLAQQSWKTWISSLDLVKVPTLLSDKDLYQRMATTQKEMDNLKLVPMYDYLLKKGNKEQIKVYYQCRWSLQHCFWKSLAEGAHRLMRQPNMRLIQIAFKNVWEELGEGEPGKTHPEMFREVAKKIGIEAPDNVPAKYVETAEFMNFRMMCMRHADLGWGLAAVFSVEEACSNDYSNWHVDLLKKVGIEKKYKTVDSTHATLDVEHAAEAFEAITMALKTKEDQSHALTSQVILTRLWHGHLNRYFQDILALE